MWFFLLFQEIYKDRKKFSKQVFEVASSDLVNMGITVVSYTLKDIRDEEVGPDFYLTHMGHIPFLRIPFSALLCIYKELTLHAKIKGSILINLIQCGKREHKRDVVTCL